LKPEPQSIYFISWILAIQYHILDNHHTPVVYN